MADLKIIVYFTVFAVVFAGLYAMASNEGTEFSGNNTLPESSDDRNIFTSLIDALTFDTGVWIIDNWFVTIAVTIMAFIVYRAIRGQ